MQEKEIQKLIADYPWLLNMNYESVPELPNSGMEFVISGKNRIDLVLRDRITGRPIFVEFKKVPFYRENIGQICEYRSRCIFEISKDDSILASIFNEYIVSPTLVLVVPSCSAEARIACNLVNIEVYEYEKEIRKFSDVRIKQNLDEMSKNLNSNILPISENRHELIDKISDHIRTILNKYGYGNEIKKFKYSPGIYYWALANFFVNLWLFKDNHISIGMYEDIFNNDYSNITIEYISKNKEFIEKFKERLYQCDFNGPIVEISENNDEAEYYLQFRENKEDFITKNEIAEMYIVNYIDIYYIEFM